MRKANDISKEIIGACIEVHKALGAGLLESAYGMCLERELTVRGMPFEKEHPVNLEYKGVRIDCAYRVDFIVGGLVVLELKAIQEILPIHHAQILTYLRLLKLRLGMLINFNVPVLKDGIKRVIL